MAVLGPKGRLAALDIAVSAARDYAANVPVSDDDTRHTFTIAVDTTGHGADYSMPLVPQSIRAHSLAEALVRAIAVPFPDWFEDDAYDQAVARLSAPDQTDRERCARCGTGLAVHRRSVDGLVCPDQ